MTVRPFTPRAYQTPMIDHVLEHPRCALFVPMGGGKTPAVLCAFDLLRLVGTATKMLVIATVRVARDVWAPEASKWAEFQHLRIACVIGTAAQRRAALMTDADIYTVNYDNVPWLIEELGGKWPFDFVVSDESTRLKSLRVSVQRSSTGKLFINGQGGARAKALAKVMFDHPCCRFVALTGTPSPNGLQDLWGQLWFMDQGQRLGANFEGFSQRWFRPHPSGYGLAPLAHTDSEIKRRISDVCMSVDLGRYMPTNAPLVHEMRVTLPPAAAQHYRQMEKLLFTELKSGAQISAASAAAKTMKCLQFANGAAYTNPEATAWETVHDAKLDALESIVEEAAGAPVLVAYHFKSDLARLLKRFPQGRALDHKPKTLADFCNGDIPVLFLHPASAGHGIDGMQRACNRIVFFSLNWNLEEHLQVIERIGPVRQAQAGFKRPVFVHYILADRTIDEVVLTRLRTKRSVQDVLLEALTHKESSHGST